MPNRPRRKLGLLIGVSAFALATASAFASAGFSGSSGPTPALSMLWGVGNPLAWGADNYLTWGA